jgi:hypothetical protein
METANLNQKWGFL